MGYCWPCVTLTGGVYYAASAHICIGLLMTGYLTYVFFHISLAHGYHGDYSFFLMLLLYSLTFLILGLLIFRGIEKKSVRILKTSAISFGVIHGLIFLRVIYVILSKLILGLGGGTDNSVDRTYSTKSSGGGGGELSSDTFGILFFTCLFFLVVIYLALLTIHIRNLQTSYNHPDNIFSQVVHHHHHHQNGDGSPMLSYAYNTVLCQP